MNYTRKVNDINRKHGRGLMVACACFFIMVGLVVKADENLVKLLVYPVDSLDERLQKQKTKSVMPQLKAPTEGDISKLTGNAQTAAIRAKQEAERNYDMLVNELALRQFDEAEKASREIQQKKGSTAYGRLMGNVTDWFSAKLGEYPDVLTVITRTDMKEGSAEQNITNEGGSTVLAKGKFKVKPALSDLNEYEEDVQLPGGTFHRRTLKTTLTVRIERFDEEVGAGTSFMVPVKCVTASGGGVGRRGDDGSLDEAMQKSLEEAAKKVVDYFSANLTVKVRGPKEDFEPGDVNLTLDGETIQMDSPKRLIKGKFLPKEKHVLQAELDGFDAVTITEPFNTDTTKTITMKPDNFELTIVVKGPAGDEEFDAGNAVITLVGNEDVGEVSLSSDSPESVKKGKYTLKVELDGYASVTQPLVFTSKSTRTITMKKAGGQ